jgi:hypothetical protein
MAPADTMRERIAAHPWPRGGVEVVRASRGYTLHSRRTGGQVARLRPTGKGDEVQVLWWRRHHRGLLLDQHLTRQRHEACKVKLRWSPSAGQFGGLDKLDPGCRQAANRVISSAPYASFGVCPAKALCGRPAL